MDGFVKMNVGGILYSIALCDIEKFSDSFFACLIKKEWSTDNDKPIHIARDGTIFRFIYMYLVSGSLPRFRADRPVLDAETVKKLEVEADFYGLADLVTQCKQYYKQDTQIDLTNYLTMQSLIANFTGYTGGSHELAVEYGSELIDALKALSVPFCTIGWLHKETWALHHPHIYNQRTCANLDVTELIAAFAEPTSNCGENQKTIETNASLLNQDCLERIAEEFFISRFAPQLQLSLRPTKLLIHREGFSQDPEPVLTSTPIEGHIGTLVVILNSEYTGGELEVTHGGRTEVVTGPYHWVAMYGDCLHKINPVTSGTRVSLIYDIYGTASDNLKSAGLMKNEYKVKQFWEHHYREKFYPCRRMGVHVGFKGLAPCQKERILDCLSREFSTYNSDTVIIALQHLYPDYQHLEPSMLKDGDRALYNLLTDDGTNINSDNFSITILSIYDNSPVTYCPTGITNSYDVQIVTVIIYRCQEEDQSGNNSTRCMLFSPAAVQRELDIEHGSESDSGSDEDNDVDSNDRDDMVIADNDSDVCVTESTKSDEESGEESKEVSRVKVLLPYTLDVKGLLDYTKEHYKSCEPEQYVVITTCLQVRKISV